MLPALVLGLWIASTLFWWAFAFAPLPSHTAEWVTAARYACFGTIASGLPAAEGWLLLVVAPATFLVAMFFLWGRELTGAVRRVARSRWGQAVFVVVAVAVMVEGTWVAAKVRAAQQVENLSAAIADTSTTLPRDYPRRTALAPDFTLVDQHGDAVALGRFRGRPVVVTFVYAHCATMCPLIVETLKQAMPGARASEILMVTLDPWRDTLSALPAAARHWELPDHFHFLSARSADDVLRVVRAYEVPFERDEKTGDVSHPGLVFVVDPDGRLAYTFNNPSPAWVRDALGRLG